MFGKNKTPKTTYKCVFIHDYMAIIPEEIREIFIPDQHDIYQYQRQFVARCRCVFERDLDFLPFTGMTYNVRHGPRFFTNSIPKLKVRDVLYDEAWPRFEVETFTEFDVNLFIRKDHWEEADLEGKRRLFEKTLIERSYGGRVFLDAGGEGCEDAPWFQWTRLNYDKVPEDALGLSEFGRDKLMKEDKRLGLLLQT